MYYEKREYVGSKIYVTKTYNSGNINAHGLSGREKTTKEMTEKQRRHNEKLRIKKLDFLLQLNFDRGDHNVTLHYPRGMCPEDEKQANENISRMLKGLKKKHKDAKYIYCTHTTKNGSIHHHLIISKDIAQYEIEEAWENTVKGAKMSVNHSMYANKSTYKKLAAYLIADQDHEPHQKKVRSFRGSKNLVRPEVERREVQAVSWRKEPRAPQGYRVEGLVNTVDIYGAPYQYYILVPDGEDPEGGGLYDPESDDY